MVDHHDEPGSSSPPPQGQGSPSGEHSGGYKPPQPAPQPTGQGSHHPGFPLLLGAVMVVTLIVAWILNMQRAPVPAPAPAATAAAPVEEKPAELSPEGKALK